jgi:hypothetical protein
VTEQSSSREAYSQLERRRSTRLTGSIPIKVTGKDALGKNFQETTSTLTYDCNGCKYPSTHYLPKDAKVKVEILGPEPGSRGKLLDAVVVWVERPKTYRDFYGVAVEFEVPGNVWGIDSPPSDWLPAPIEQDAAETTAEYPAELPVVSTVATMEVISGNGPKAGVAVAEEVVVDCTTDMTSWETNSDPQSTESRVYTANHEAELAAQQAMSAAIDGLSGQMQAMRHQFDAAIREISQQNEDRITGALEEIRAEMRALRDTVTASLENKGKSSSKRKSRQTSEET